MLWHINLGRFSNLIISPRNQGPNSGNEIVILSLILLWRSQWSAVKWIFHFNQLFYPHIYLELAWQVVLISLPRSMILLRKCCYLSRCNHYSNFPRVLNLPPSQSYFTFSSPKFFLFVFSSVLYYQLLSVDYQSFVRSWLPTSEQVWYRMLLFLLVKY